MTILFLGESLVIYTMNIYSKYLNGTIFTNFYMMYSAALIGVITSSFAYSIGLRKSFVIVSLMLLKSCAVLYCFESGIFDPEVIYWLGISEASPYT
jgi:hypothetical protein